MKRIMFVLAALAATTFVFAQSKGIEELGERGQSAPPPVSSPDRTVVGDRRLISDETSEWAEYDRTSNCTTLKCAAGEICRVAGKLHLGPLPCDLWIDNYYLNKKTGVGVPHREKLRAGTLVWFDENNTPICKASCKNPLGGKVSPGMTVKQNNTTIYRERTRTQVWQQDVDHYHTDIREVPVPEYHLVRIYGPQNQYIGQFAAPTVVQGGGGGGFSIDLGTRVTANGGNGYGAAAAAAAAAASSSSTSTTPTSGAGTSGGSSGGSSSGAGGGPSNSGSGTRGH